MNNLSLKKAKVEKNDEFYTQLNDVSKELIHYKQHFKNKIVYCNCDNPIQSAFWEYFHLNFEELELKELISTHYDNNQSTYKMVYIGKNDSNIQIGIKTNLQNNGDFRSQECLDILDKSDIIVTNPPFSLFREYIDLIMKYNKKFLVIGNKNAINYNNIFFYIKDNKIKIGYERPNEFDTPQGTTMKLNGLCRWFTNLDVKEKRNTFNYFYKEIKILLILKKEIKIFEKFSKINLQTYFFTVNLDFLVIAL